MLGVKQKHTEVIEYISHNFTITIASEKYFTFFGKKSFEIVLLTLKVIK